MQTIFHINLLIYLDFSIIIATVTMVKIVATATIISCFFLDCIQMLCDDSQGGASGTVNKQVFIDWPTLKILPLLGSFEKGGNRSIVTLDNASIHMDEEIVSLIQSKGGGIYPIHCCI
jgi:hypothetical protein